MKKEQLIDLDRKQLALVKQILNQHIPNKEVWAYGSRVNWKASQVADLDIAVHNSTLSEISNLKESFEESELLISVDVMDWEEIPEDFKKNIRNKYIVLQKGNGIPEGWKEVKLEDIATVDWGNTNLTIKSFKEDGKFLGVRAAGCDGKINHYEHEVGVTVVSAIGSNCGRVFFPKEKFTAIKNTITVTPLRKKINPSFLFYTMIKNNLPKRGSGQPFITKGDVNKYQINIPPLPEQKAIAEVLSSLDDKIDLLQHQNKTLEDMAQALFRKWFVEDADEKWEEKPLDKIADYLNGLACQKYPPKNQTDKLPVLKIRELTNGITNQSDWASSQVDKQYVINLGDVVFSWSGSLIVRIWNGDKAVLNQHLFKVTSKEYPKWFFYLWTKHHMQKFLAIAKSKATTMGHIKRDDLTNSYALIPPKKTLDDMDAKVSPLFEQLIVNYQSIRTLEAQRDNLLPKLMSGDTKIYKENENES